jgi:hypothetical protein
MSRIVCLKDVYSIDYGTWTFMAYLDGEANSINGFKAWIAKKNTVIGLVMQSKSTISHLLI